MRAGGCRRPGGDGTAGPCLIWDRCQNATELEDGAIAELLDQRARALGFVPQAQTLEVHGLCAQCAAPD